MISSRAEVKIDERPESVIIAIKPVLTGWQSVALHGWLLLWLTCGVLAAVGMMGAQDDRQRVYMIVFLGFWLYFLFVACRTAVWYAIGAEYIRITSESMDYKRSWGTYGRVQNFDIGTIRQAGMVNHDGNIFAKTYAQAFWGMGSERIGFEYIGRKVVFGLRLDDAGARSVLKKIQSAQRRK